MKTYQYTSQENTVVHVIDEDGISRMSMLASAVPDGAEILPYDAPSAPVPQQITRAQGKIVLLQLGLWQPALDYVAGLTDPLAKATGEVALHDTTYWARSSPFLNAAAESLGLSSADLDALFVTASEIIL